MSLITQDKAVSFLKKLGIQDGLAKLQSDPQKFMRELISAYQEHMPWQTVSMVAQSKEERHVPTLEEIVETGLSLEGGVCLTLNVFFCLFLRAIGLKVDLLDGNYSSSGNDHSHVILLLNDLRSQGDSYIIDLGCGFPSLEMIPLADLPVKHIHAGLEYKYQYFEDKVVRLHRTGDEMLDGEKPVMRGEWRQVFHFNLNPVEFDYFQPYMHPIYTDEEDFDFLRCIRAVCFPPKDGDNDKRIMMAFKNQSMLIGPMDAATKTKMEADVWPAKLKELFPTIPPTKIDVAVQKILEYQGL